MPKPTDYRINGLEALNPRAILCCQQRQIGDVLLLTPSLRMLKKRFPQARIDVFTERKCAPVLENNPDVGHVWTIDRSLGMLRNLAFYRRVGKGPDGKGYDLIVDFQQLPRIRWVLALAKCPVKLSYPPPWYNMLLYTHWAPVSGPYAAKCKAGVLMNALGLPWENEPPRLYLTDAERERAGELLAGWGLREGQRLVTVDATHRRITRRWPAGHYAELMRKVTQARPEVRFLLLYGPGELEVVRQVAAQADLDGRVIVPGEMLSLREMAAVQQRAALHLGNCSSPRHFALAVGTPTFTLRGSTSSSWTYPGPGHEDMSLGLPCQPCDENTCALDRECLRGLTPDMALPRVLRMLGMPKNAQNS